LKSEQMLKVSPGSDIRIEGKYKAGIYFNRTKQKNGLKTGPLSGDFHFEASTLEDFHSES